MSECKKNCQCAHCVYDRMYYGEEERRKYGKNLEQRVALLLICLASCGAGYAIAMLVVSLTK